MDELLELSIKEIRTMKNEQVFLIDFSMLIDQWIMALPLSVQRKPLAGHLLFIQMVENILYYHSLWNKPEEIIDSILRSAMVKIDEARLYSIQEKVRQMLFGNYKIPNSKWGIYTAEFTHGLTSDNPYVISVCYKGDYRVEQFERQSKHLRERSGHLKRPIEHRTDPRNYR